jgi:hypothetical protein
MDALSQLTARDEIRQLAERYKLAIDSRDLDVLVALFVPDAECGRQTGCGTVPECWQSGQRFQLGRAAAGRVPRLIIDRRQT